MSQCSKDSTVQIAWASFRFSVFTIYCTTYFNCTGSVGHDKISINYLHHYHHYMYDHPVLFQVIRRGDRRPFYAPARYVMEVKSDQARLQVGECDVVDNLAVVDVDVYVNASTLWRSSLIRQSCGWF